jgi:hypothetical protein
MKKQELLDLILELPANRREQLADEIYQSLDAVDPDLNSAWIVEANHLMTRLEKIPPPIPEEPFDAADQDPEEVEEVPRYKREMSTVELVDELHIRCSISVSLRDKREGIPHEEVMQELRTRSTQREKQKEELFGDLEPLRGTAPDVTAVRTLDDFKLRLKFEDREQRIFDMKTYRKGMLSGLKDPEYFSWARVHWGGVHWPDGERLWAKLLYKKSEPAENRQTDKNSDS